MQKPVENDSEAWRKRIELVRKAKGLSMSEVSRRADLSLAYYQKIITVGQDPGIDNFFKICDALNVSPRDILQMDSEAERLWRRWQKLGSDKKKQAFLDMLPEDEDKG